VGVGGELQAWLELSLPAGSIGSLASNASSPQRRKVSADHGQTMSDYNSPGSNPEISTRDKIMAIDSYVTGVFLIAGTVAMAIVGLLAVRRTVNVQTLKECHEVGGYLLSVVGTLYAVLLGLVVVDSMQRFQSAQVTCQQEANSLADIYLLADHLPKEKQLEVKRLCLAYADDVIHKEWPTMDDGKESTDTRNKALKIMKALNAFEPQTNNESDMYQTVLSEACQLWDNRRARTNVAQYGVPVEEWMVLIAGGIVTIFFTYFFGMESLPLQVLMTTMITTLIGLNLLLVLWFGYPFSGDRKVHPSAFQVDQEVFATELSNIQQPSRKL